MPVLTLPTRGEITFVSHSSLLQLFVSEWNLTGRFGTSSPVNLTVACVVFGALTHLWGDADPLLPLHRSPNWRSTATRSPKASGTRRGSRTWRGTGDSGDAHCLCYGFISLILVVSYVSFSFFLTFILFFGLAVPFFFPFLSCTDFCTTCL